MAGDEVYRIEVKAMKEKDEEAEKALEEETPSLLDEKRERESMSRMIAFQEG